MNRVLIVEDDRNSRIAMETFLRDQGYQVRSAGTGSDAVRLGNRFQPDLLICDWILGGDMDGVTAARKLFELNPGTQIVFVTGLPVKELESKSSDLPVSRYLSKPISLLLLGSVLNEILEPLRGDGAQ